MHLLRLLIVAASGMYAISATGAETSTPLATERLAGQGVWVAPEVEQQAMRTSPVRVVVWFEQQFLGDGEAYVRRSREFAVAERRSLRRSVVATLQQLSRESFAAAKPELDKLVDAEAISKVQPHWVVNGFSCTTTSDGLEKLKDVPGVRKIFLGRNFPFGNLGSRRLQKAVAASEPRNKFDPNRYQHPWYTRALQADRVWKTWNVTGRGTLNVVHDGNFVFSKNIAANVFRNPGEIPDNEIDDDGNGLVDDVHGYNFQRGNNRLTVRSAPGNRFSGQLMHGSMCAAIICGAGTKESPHEFGLAPEARWAGVVAGAALESAVEWAILQEADTYSMSFSIPRLGETRSHWRKVMEHGSFCGVYFVSGAGNFARSAQIPVQMRIPEDIPNVVFAAAGVQRDFSKTPFSSMGPVEWLTEHYRDGRVQKPEVCAFNMGLPLQKVDGTVEGSGLNGNSFAGPMFCGSIALMLSADPDLLPWDLREIITTTATDVAKPGVDDETGHGLINCYRAVKEVLRRKALREWRDSTPYTGREPNDALNIKLRRKQLGERQLVVSRVQPGSSAAAAGIKARDIVVSLNGTAISDVPGFQDARAKAAGEPLTLEVKRGADTLKVELKPGRFGVGIAMDYAEPVFE